jgi:hypothetical protein
VTPAGALRIENVADVLSGGVTKLGYEGTCSAMGRFPLIRRGIITLPGCLRFLMFTFDLDWKPGISAPMSHQVGTRKYAIEDLRENPRP